MSPRLLRWLALTLMVIVTAACTEPGNSPPIGKQDLQPLDLSRDIAEPVDLTDADFIADAHDADLDTDADQTSDADAQTDADDASDLAVDP